VVDSGKQAIEDAGAALRTALRAGTEAVASSATTGSLTVAAPYLQSGTPPF
jgi:hypothetical protein